LGAAGFLAVLAVALPILEYRDNPLHYEQGFYFLYLTAAFFLLAAGFVALLPLYLIGLSVSPQRIEYCDGFIRIAADWDQVERIGQHDFGLRSVEGLILKQPALTCTKWAWPMAWSIPLLFGKDFARFINVAMFEKRWKDGAIGREIRSRAPELFTSVAPLEQSQSGEAERRDADQGGDRPIGGWLILVALWLALVLGGGVFGLLLIGLPVFSPEMLAWVESDLPAAGVVGMLVIYLETAALVGFSLGAAGLLVLFFLKKRTFRKRMLVFLVALWAFTVVDFALTQLLRYWKGLEVGPPGPTLGFQIKMYVLCALFLYVVRSSRLKQTFGN
jgi:hypothetical protein